MRRKQSLTEKLREMDSQEREEGSEIQAQAQVWKHIYSFSESLTLKCAVELGIADIIYAHGHPLTITELAAHLPVKTAPDRLYRLMRFLVKLGIFGREKSCDCREEKYALNRMSKLLVRGAENNFVPMVMMDLEVLMVPWYNLLGSLEDKAQTVFERAYGLKFWEYGEENPEFGQQMNEVMACDTRLTVPAIIKEFKDVFESIGSLVDVGGGTGTAARAIAEAFPHIDCTVFDLPDVIQASPQYLSVSRVAGDMFKFIPHADALLLKWILHNFGDPDCITILKKCKESLPEKGGKLIIIETVLYDNGPTDEFSSARLTMDVEMMLLFGGKERTHGEWRRLLEHAGFGECKITRIKSCIHSFIEVHP